MVLCLERGRGKWSGLGQLQELIAPQGERTLGNIVKGESLTGPGAKGEREAVGHWVEPWERRQVRWASGGRPDGHQALLYPPLLSPSPAPGSRCQPAGIPAGGGGNDGAVSAHRWKGRPDTAQHNVAEAWRGDCGARQGPGGKYHLEHVLGTRSEWASNDQLNISKFILNAARSP